METLYPSRHHDLTVPQASLPCIDSFVGLLNLTVILPEKYFTFCIHQSVNLESCNVLRSEDNLSLRVVEEYVQLKK